LRGEIQTLRSNCTGIAQELHINGLYCTMFCSGIVAVRCEIVEVKNTYGMMVYLTRRASTAQGCARARVMRASLLARTGQVPDMGVKIFARNHSMLTVLSPDRVARRQQGRKVDPIREGAKRFPWQFPCGVSRGCMRVSRGSLRLGHSPIDASQRPSRLTDHPKVARTNHY